VNKESEVKTTELYGKMGEYLARVRWGKESFVVKRRGKPLARLDAQVIPPGRDGIRRFPVPEYLRATPAKFRSEMADYLTLVRKGGRKVLITYRGKVVAILKPLTDWS
jgi:antitoxin (DNA-binding transcriptional repressor) of toxin-antitoxin stability system